MQARASENVPPGQDEIDAAERLVDSIERMAKREKLLNQLCDVVTQARAALKPPPCNRRPATAAAAPKRATPRPVL